MSTKPLYTLYFGLSYMKFKCNETHLKKNFTNYVDTSVYSMFSNKKLSAKNLTESRMSILGQLTYPVTPLLSVDLSCITNPYDKSFVILPLLSLSVSNDIDFSINGQLFVGDAGDEFGLDDQIMHMMIKFSF